MDRDSIRGLQVSFSGLRFLITIVAIIWLLTAIGLGWLVKSFFILIALLLLAPIVGYIGLRWWLKRNMLTAECPVCHSETVGLRNSQFNCLSCGEPLKFDNEQLVRVTPPGTVDVEVIEVPKEEIRD